ncbi:flagellar biosynthesis protein FlhF [Paenibacillus endoradicis]|uniref:flagellar biosynthesis protein FlhF n=1 Tax=Paenibacillus endoradicis TaxID=2972487 RepID=UPI0021596C9A|nr:flagellar biosynthesis protein FlhF [Paenibacillus endoradicis]MCR8656269.1 flagellar biosynthesis protein FlhF [Paenibacillus endoradicis]
MRVKRYVVDTLPDAVSLIRDEMGNDAVILETKEIKIGGFLGMFQKRKIEVMAAVEPSAQKKPKKITSDQVDYVVDQILKASQRNKESAMVEEDEVRTSPSPVTQAKANEALAIRNSSSFASKLYGGPSQVDSPVQRESTKESIPANSSQGEVTTSMEALVKTDVQQYQSQELVKEKSNDFSQTELFIVNELKSLRHEMQRLASNSNDTRSLSPAVEAIKQRLGEQEIFEQWIEVISDELYELEIQNNELLSIDAVWDFSKQKFLEWLSPYRCAEINSNSRVVQFVGPTGVGKTTTIAKLSANYSIKDGKKMGLITADTYRIAAVEQLRTYANILNIPLEVVFSPLDLQRAFAQLEQAELIFMDTAGRNFKSDIHVSEVNSLLQTDEASEAILVLSLTSRTQDMNVVAEKFSKYGVRKVVFTKLDEANVYGSIFNMIMMYGLQPLFVTSGQNVPDDIEAFSIEGYIELLLGDPHHE